MMNKANKSTINKPTNEEWVNYSFRLDVSTTTLVDIIGKCYYSYDNLSSTKLGTSANKSSVGAAKITKK